MVQTRVVRLELLLVPVSASLVACAHTREEVHTTTVNEVAPATIDDRDVIAIDTSPPPPEPAPVSRPRLSRTITLGEAQYAPSAPREQTTARELNVVVNNNVYVQGTPQWQWYGGHVGYGGYAHYGRPTTFYEGARSSPGWGARPQWGATGWEGPARTAAPGQTPGVGGNWPTLPSYGPAPMK